MTEDKFDLDGKRYVRVFIGPHRWVCEDSLYFRSDPLFVFGGPADQLPAVAAVYLLGVKWGERLGRMQLQNEIKKVLGL